MDIQINKDIKEFCDLKCNRYEFLINWLSKEEITHSVIPTGKARHIMIRLDKSRPYLKRYFVKTLIAHYDRVNGTPGANDNSAAVFQLLYSIKKLKALKFAHNIQIILTDKEELVPGEPVINQGSYQLANLFKEKKINNCIFFVFDMCGIGDTLVSGLAGLELLKFKYKKDSKYKKHYDEMLYFNYTLSNILLQFKEGDFFNLNYLFSDDLGFLLNRYPAMQLSILPYKEIIEIKKILSDLKANDWNKTLEKGILSEEYLTFLKSKLPNSWKTNHKAEDIPENLDPQAFNLIDDLIIQLAEYQIPFGDRNL